VHDLEIEKEYKIIYFAMGEIEEITNRYTDIFIRNLIIERNFTLSQREFKLHILLLLIFVHFIF